MMRVCERVSTGGARGRLSLSQNWLLDNVRLLWKASIVNDTRLLARSLSDSKTLLRATQPGAPVSPWTSAKVDRVYPSFPELPTMCYQVEASHHKLTRGFSEDSSGGLSG